MQIKGNTIAFKSTQDMYAAEESGAKQNTVRILYGDELKELEQSVLYRIQITESAYNQPFRGFDRRLTHIAKIGEILGGEIYVFSWRDDEFTE